METLQVSSLTFTIMILATRDDAREPTRHTGPPCHLLEWFSNGSP